MTWTWWWKILLGVVCYALFLWGLGATVDFVRDVNRMRNTRHFKIQDDEPMRCWGYAKKFQGDILSLEDGREISLMYMVSCPKTNLQ